jgi:hypothetical protein
MVTKDNASSARSGWGVNLSGTDPKKSVIAYDIDSGGFRYDHPTPADDHRVYHHIVMQRNGDNVESWLAGKRIKSYRVGWTRGDGDTRSITRLTSYRTFASRCNMRVTFITMKTPPNR